MDSFINKFYSTLDAVIVIFTMLFISYTLILDSDITNKDLANLIVLVAGTYNILNKKNKCRNYLYY